MLRFWSTGRPSTSVRLPFKDASGAALNSTGTLVRFAVIGTGSAVIPSGNPSNTTFRSPPQLFLEALTIKAIRLPRATASVVGTY